MKLPQHLFALSRGEQRVVIIIVLVLLGGTMAKRAYDEATRPPPVPVPLGATPFASPPEDESLSAAETE